MGTTTHGAKTRWGAGQRRDPKDARERLIDCAIACYHARGVHKTVMDHIAAEAQVTRQTIYRYFDSQQAILRAVLLRDIEFFWHINAENLHHIESHDDYLIEPLLSAINYAAHNPDHLIAFTTELKPALMDFLVTDSEYELNIVNFLRPRLIERAGRIAQSIDDRISLICEWFNRMLASYLAKPSRYCEQLDEMRPRLRLMLPVLAAITTTESETPDDQ